MAKRGQSPSVSLLIAILAVIWVGLSYSLGAVYEHALSDLVIGWVARWIGMTTAHLMELYGPYVAPGGAAALLLILAHRVSYWFLSQTVFAEDPHANALTLSSMSVTEIAEYLRDKSKWSWRTYTRLNLKEFVRDHVSVEMTRAGRDGEVRFIGTRPIESVAHPIDATYWRFYRIDNDRLWDGRNEFFYRRTRNRPWCTR
jgi:hypothetical protein